MNLELGFMCRRKNILRRIWPFWKRNVSMTTGISIQTEACQICGMVSRSLFHWKQNLSIKRKTSERLHTCGPRKDWQTFQRLPDKIMYDRKYEPWLMKPLRIERNKWKSEKPKLDNVRRQKGIYFIDFDDQHYNETSEIHVLGGKCNYLVITGDVLSKASVTLDFFSAKSTSVLFWSTQCELCKFCLTSVELNSCRSHQVLVVVSRQFFFVTWLRVLELRHVRATAQENFMCFCLVPQQLSKMWGENWKDTFCLKVSLLQFGSQIYSFAWSDEGSLCKSCSGQRMEKVLDNSSMANGKSRVRKDVMLEAQTEEKKVHSAALMDILSPPKHGVSTPSCKNTMTESCSVVKLWQTTLGPSQFLLNRVRGRPTWLPQKWWDVVARLPDCDGQAADAVSAYTQLELENTPRLFKIRESGCPDMWKKTFFTTEMADILGKHRRPCGTSRTKSMRTSSWWSLVGKTVRRHVLGSWMGKKYQLGSVCLFIEHEDCFLSVHAHDTNMPWKKKNLAPMWKRLMKNVILTNQHHFLIIYTWDVLNVNASRMILLLKNGQKITYSAGETEKLPQKQ